MPDERKTTRNTRGLTLFVGSTTIRSCHRPGFRMTSRTRSGSLSRLRSVAERSPVPIYTDESFNEPADLIDHAEAGVAGVSMKTIKMGGITGFMNAASLARLLRLGVNVAGKSATSSIGGAAMLHIGTALPEMSGGIGLSNHKLVQDVVANPVGLVDGELRAPTGPGLGVDVDEAVIDGFVRHRETVGV